jgi:glyoxylase-like metal-dependent hydrolase (beta-lactamase superfamily II)
MDKPIIHTIDLKFQGISSAIGIFLIPHPNGAAMVECGPGSTIPGVIQALDELQLKPSDITDVFLTHIHLDHAGSAGWWANQGARIHVHHVGGPHLLHPEKLLASAKRIYGAEMDNLWGEFLPVDQERINFLYDGDEIKINGLTMKAIDTPGHSNHHITYLYDGICFTGDVGGVRLQGINVIRLPTVPPEFHVEKWLHSINKLRNEEISEIATTHFGLHSDSQWHLNSLENTLVDIESWMSSIMLEKPSLESFRERYSDYIYQQSIQQGLSGEMIGTFDLAISSQMSADGIYRYWHKYRC